MGFDIDFFPVGEESQGGDAIAIRYGNLLSNPVQQKVILIDGGFKDTSELIIDHINQKYGTNIINLLISTHPDQDHCSGLEDVIAKMDVKEIWMHRPWNHAKEILPYLKDSRWTDTGLVKCIKDNYPYAFNLEQMAIKKKLIPIEPFEGRSYDNDILKILSPSYQHYLLYLINFEKMPEPLEKYKIQRRKIIKEAKRAINWIKEKWNDEKLVDPQIGDTSFENESSTIILFRTENKKALFTADAGIFAFNESAKYCSNNYIDISNLNLVQVPHHGSKHNIGPSTLDKIIGCKFSENEVKNLGFGIVSVAKKTDDKHPSRRVTNAFYKRGYRIWETRGNHKMWNINSPRKGFDVDPIPYYTEVEDD